MSDLLTQAKAAARLGANVAVDDLGLGGLHGLNIGGVWVGRLRACEAGALVDFLSTLRMQTYRVTVNDQEYAYEANEDATKREIADGIAVAINGQAHGISCKVTEDSEGNIGMSVAQRGPANYIKMEIEGRTYES